MDDDPLFNLDVVRDFMISKNFKVSNRVLVSHFKPFLTHSDRREINREKFRDYVNTLSTVKQDEQGEKILVLKKKYRKASADGLLADSKKRDKQKDKFPSPNTSPSVHAQPSAASVPADCPAPPKDVVSSALEGLTNPASDLAAASPGSEVVEAEAISRGLHAPSLKVTKPSVTDEDDVTDGMCASRMLDVTGSPAANESSDALSLGDSPNDKENVRIDDENFKLVPIANAMSVKERAKHLNKIESDSNLQSNSVKMRHKHGEKREDDSSSVSSGGYLPMDQMDRDWMITVSTADYHPIHRLLNQKPELAKRRDFLTGFSALHWAAKHGKAEVVKLLCGIPGVNVNARSNGGYTPLHMAAQQGFEDIIELLVHGYHADPNLRDYSGKKPKQYLRNSASSRTHQILQARRASANIVNGHPPFKRVGSYSSKIHKSGFFGIHGPSILRSSWTGGSDGGSDKDRTSPAPSLSPSPSPRSSPLPSPKSRRKGSRPDYWRSQSERQVQNLADGYDQTLMPPPAPYATASRKKRARKEDKDKENVSRLARPHSVPVNLERACSSPELPQRPLAAAPITSPFI